jgi:hypothetical protein
MNKEAIGSIGRLCVRASSTINSKPIWFLSIRLCAGIFVLMTAGYCVLAFMPFSYHWILMVPHGSLAHGVRGFGRIYPFLYVVVFLLVTLTLLPAGFSTKARRLSMGFILVHALIGIWLFIHPFLTALANDETSLRWAMISLFPMLWIAAIDYVREGKNWSLEKNQGNLQYKVFLLWAGFLALLYIAVFFLRFSKDGVIQFHPSELIFAIAWSIVSHFLLAILLLTVLRLLRSFANRFSQATKVEFLLCNGLAAIFMTLILRYIVFSAISFNGTFALVFAFVFSFSLMAFVSGCNVRLSGIGEEKSASGLSLALLPLLSITPKLKSSLGFRAVWLIVLMFLAYKVPQQLAVTDWAFLMQKLSVIGVWIISFAFFYAGAAKIPDKKYSFAGLFLLAALSFISYRVVYLARYNFPMILNQERLDVNLALERYDAYEISFKVAHSILHPNINLFPTAKTDTQAWAREEVFDDAFYGFLNRSTNLKDSANITAVDVNLVENLVPKQGKKPNIFIFVVDSLRQDYIAPYNKAVTFTPSLEQFASESIVMQNSFTRYSGTGLAEPSIWTGSMLLHKLYTQPFYPMNALQKLIETEGYDNIMTIDPVLEIIVKPSPTISKLDEGKDWSLYDMCATIKELQEKIENRSDQTKPLFVYTQSQNLHMVGRTSGFRQTPTFEGHPEHPAFDKYCATRLKPMDSCFGEFIAYLKSRKMYDDSIIVFTSDHGDYLGEGGRWGHGYYINPELIRIPLIIHVPPHLLKGKVWSTKEVAFSADITPSLYYLLGHRPIVNNHIFGRPLFTETQKEQTDYLEENYLIGSSYGVVYGILSRKGRSLFISDVSNGSDMFYNIEDDPKCERNQVTENIKAKNRELIYTYVSEINKFFNYEAPR